MRWLSKPWLEVPASAATIARSAISATLQALGTTIAPSNALWRHRILSIRNCGLRLALDTNRCTDLCRGNAPVVEESKQPMRCGSPSGNFSNAPIRSDLPMRRFGYDVMARARLQIVLAVLGLRYLCMLCTWCTLRTIGPYVKLSRISAPIPHLAVLANPA